MELRQELLNKAKKELYKQKPIAEFMYEDEENKSHVYITKLGNDTIVRFEVPLEDMGKTPFRQEEPAQLLIRWISKVIIDLNRLNIKEGEK